jgi:hypothetical protein
MTDALCLPVEDFWMHRFKSAPLTLATLCLCLNPAVPAVAIAERAAGAIAQN